MYDSKINEKCAERLFEVVPPVMQILRHEMRAAVQGHLSIAQFRVLARLEKGVAGGGALADWIGISLPAMSRMVDGLVRRGYIKRNRQMKDRRHVQLALTAPGKRFYAQVKDKAQKTMSRQLAELSLQQRESLMGSLKILQSSLLNLEDTHEKDVPFFYSPISSDRLRP